MESEEQRDPLAQEPKPLISRILPWVVLLLAALALFYFLNRGCAGSRAKEGVEHVEQQQGDQSEGSTMTKSAQPKAAEEKEVKAVNKSIELPGAAKISAAEGSAMAKFAQALAAGTATENSVFILDQGEFQGKSAVLTRASEKELELLASILKAYPDTKVRFEAHTDNTGSADINMQLSTQQALSVRTYLVDRGININRMMCVGRGQTKPLGPNDTDSGRAQNKRIEMYILG